MTEYNEADDNIMEILSTVLCVLSLIGALYPLLTAWVFYEQMTREKMFMQLLTLISASTLVSSISGLFGFPRTESLCYAQSFLWTFGSRSAWMYATVTSFELLYYMEYGQFFCDINLVSGVNLILNATLASVPYFFGVEYGLPKSYLGTSFCKLHKIRKTDDCDICPEVMLINFFIPGLVMMIAMIIASVMLRNKMKKNESLLEAGGNEYNNRIIRQVLVYPFGIMLFWAPLFVYFIIQYSSDIYIGGDSNADHVVFNIVNAITTIEGLYIATAFYLSSFESRRRWRLLLFGDSKGEELSGVNNRSSTASSTSISSSSTTLAYADFSDPDFLRNEDMVKFSREKSASMMSRGSEQVREGEAADKMTNLNRGPSFHFSAKRRETGEEKRARDIMEQEILGRRGSSEFDKSREGFEMTLTEVSSPLASANED